MKTDKLSNEELQSLIEIQEAIVSDAIHEKEFELKILSALQKLEGYRRAEEEHRLFIFKHKVGDTYYKIGFNTCHKGESLPDTFTCCGCDDDCDLKRIVKEEKIRSIEWLISNEKYFGESYFDTKEGAVKQFISKCFMTKRFENPGMEESMCAGLRTLNGDGEPCDTCKNCMMYYGYEEE